MDPKVNDLDNDIRATADDIATDAERIRAIESEKARLAADDPRLVDLARESEDLAAKLATKTRVETALVNEAQAEEPEPGPSN